MEIKNLKKASKRIIKAIKNKEKIIIYGDADLDGACSVIIFEETIKNLGAKTPVIYFPDREEEGYGLTETALNYLEKEAPALLITFDCGIGNFKEIKLAKKLGFEVMVVDHHETLDKLPAASIIVDPKQKGDKYPFKEFAATGVVYKLSQVILKDKLTDSLKRNFLELTTLATIADMMPEVNENAEIIEEGLLYLETSWRPGIKASLDSIDDILDLRQKISKIISLLNVRDVQDRFPASFRLLTAATSREAEKILEILFQKLLLRKERIKEIIAQVEEKISQEKEFPIIFSGDPLWELILLGSVASIFSKEYKKPVFLFKKEEKESQGTVRLVKGLNGVKAMLSCRDLLITFGGHPQACGFKLKNENLENFRNCLINYFSEKQ